MTKAALLGLSLVTVFAFSAPATAREKNSKGDPNRVICRTEEVVGSRLSRQKRCMTAFEWAEMKRLDRQSIERIQDSRIKNN